MISGLVNSDSLPVLDRMLQFAAGRQKLLADNVANFDTPGYRAKDVSATEFRAALGEAVDDRRDRHGNRGGQLNLGDTSDVDVRSDRLDLRPVESNENVLFHDDNDRDLDRTMQALAENVLTIRTVTTLQRSRIDLLSSAFRERP